MALGMLKRRVRLRSLHSWHPISPVWYPLTLPAALGCSWEEIEQNGVCWRRTGPGWGRTHRHVAVQGAQEMLRGTDQGPPESIHCLHGPGQPAGGEEDQALCCIPGHGRDLLHAGDAGGAGSLQVVSHAAHEPGVLSRLPRETSSAPGPQLCPTSPSRQDRGGPGFPTPFAALRLRDFSSLLCRNHHGSLQQGLSLSPPSPPTPGPGGPSARGCASAAGRGKGH